MIREGPVPDADIRLAAETTFDRNLVVIAGAGTGKTTLLVNRLVHALMREPDPVAITEVVALTFTNKAATEIKGRLRQRLVALLKNNGSSESAVSVGAVDRPTLQARYRIPVDQLAQRAEAALRDLEKAQIGTLHSFAAHLLRLHPIEGGVDPRFQEDDGTRFDEGFREAWDKWLAVELGPDGEHQDHWRRVLSALGLGPINELAYALCSELVPLDSLAQELEYERIPTPIDNWLEGKRDRIQELLAGHRREKPRKIENLLGLAESSLGWVLANGVPGLQKLGSSEREQLDQSIGKAPAGWSLSEYEEACGLINIARALHSVDQRLFQDLLAVLSPFVRQVRSQFLEEGWITFDGLLARAKTLLHDHRAIRQRLKQEYKTVLVDEFQDTDPIQYEIVLYLVEDQASFSGNWRDVKLAKGKLFIVGDPKQSIYAFRRADVEAFHHVVEKIRHEGGEVCDLQTNFRSHGAVLDVVNAVFDRLLQAEDLVQPPNVPLLVQPGRQGGGKFPGVALRLVGKGDEDGELDAAAATRMEAEELARWVKDGLLLHEALTDGYGAITPLKPGHIALLFRKLTQAEDYLEALRRHEIPYVTDGEKHYYRQQEVVDLVNVLRVLEDPHDRVGLVGVLRSPLGGLTDLDVYQLHECSALDYRNLERVQGWDSPRAHVVSRLYEIFSELSRLIRRCSLPDALDLIFARLPVLELASASVHGEQALANLVKLRALAAELGDRPQMALSGFVDLLVNRVAEQSEEEESTLGEESLEAVRIMTVHKAKGLEFPIVILPGLHHGSSPSQSGAAVSGDWSSGVMGLAAGGRRSLGYLLVDEKRRLREQAERRRLLYVGMTRARERLILSGGLPTRPPQGAFLSLLRETAPDSVGIRGESMIKIGSASIKQTVLSGKDHFPRARTPRPVDLRPSQDMSAFVARWKERDARWALARSAPTHLSPSGSQEQDLCVMPRGSEGPEPGREPERARLIGRLAHRVLEHWDFNGDAEELSNQIEAICKHEFPRMQHGDVESLIEELREMFVGFRASQVYGELCRADILGREVPFAIPWPPPQPRSRPAAESSAEELGLSEADAPARRRLGEGGSSFLSPQSCVMHGVMDLLCRLDGHIWVVDYKTDMVRGQELEELASSYRNQVEVYGQAARVCLGVEKVRCKLVFLRSGQEIEI